MQEVNKEIGINHTEIPCFYDDRDKGWGEKTTDYCPTQRANRSGIKMINNSNGGYRIRRLTPKECWRLMGFSDESFERARKALNDKFYGGSDRSASQLYKQAGNSIVTDVLFYIFYELYTAMPYLFDDLKVSSYFSGIGAFEIALDRLFDTINGQPEKISLKSGGEKYNSL